MKVYVVMKYAEKSYRDIVPRDVQHVFARKEDAKSYVLAQAPNTHCVEKWHVREQADAETYRNAIGALQGEIKQLELDVAKQALKTSIVSSCSTEFSEMPTEKADKDGIDMAETKEQS